MKTILQVLTLASAIFIPVSAVAENISLNFYALGLRAGTITVNGKETAQSYALSGSVTPTRLLKSIKDVGYSGSASGSVKKGKLYSRRYAGNARTGSRNSTVIMHWNGNKPVVDKYQPAREKRSYDIDPPKQTGTKDLLTAAYATFKTTSADKLCKTTHHMFDGRRRSKLILGAPKISGKTATCAGTYKRVAGFSPSQMQKKVNFPFSLKYEQMEDGNYRFMEFSAHATFGKIRATRK